MWQQLNRSTNSSLTWHMRRQRSLQLMLHWKPSKISLPPFTLSPCSFFFFVVVWVRKSNQQFSSWITNQLFKLWLSPTFSLFLLFLLFFVVAASFYSILFCLHIETIIQRITHTACNNNNNNTKLALIISTSLCLALLAPVRSALISVPSQVCCKQMLPPSLFS